MLGSPTSKAASSRRTPKGGRDLLGSWKVAFLSCRENIVKVRLFARAKDLAGTDLITVDVPEGATVADLRRRLAALHPALAGLLQRSALAVNDEFADEAMTLPPRAEVALLPPVSGG
jgi:molybdopterin converting factor subunit 1